VLLSSSFTKIYNATILFYYEDDSIEMLLKEKTIKNWHKD
jgi:hypothetical protein